MAKNQIVKIKMMTEEEMIENIVQDYQEWMEAYEKMGMNGERVVSLVLATRLKRAIEKEEICNYVEHAR